MRQRALDSISLTAWLLAAGIGWLLDEIQYRRQLRVARKVYGA